jgi:CDP-diacylglycerol--glycerol-3-phosphate 3-phosphatidyltransferase
MPVDASSIKTWANLVTVARVLVSPFMFLLIPDKPGGTWVAFVPWFVLCASDGIDGYLARRYGATNLGAFLDPLADKVLVLGAMFFLVHNHTFWILPVAVMAGRELLISLYRTFVGAKGISVPASKVAKWKTFVQQLAVGFAIMPPTALDATWLWKVLLWIAVTLTLISGGQYIWRAAKLKSQPVVSAAIEVS